MHRERAFVLTISLALLYAGTLCAASAGKTGKGVFTKNRPAPVRADLSRCTAAELYQQKISCIKPVFKYQPGAIPVILDDIQFSDFSDTPEEYEIWSTSSVNPYNVSLTDMKDTIKIDVSGFHPPAATYVTSDFGLRKWRMHNGIDIKVYRGDTVKCAFDGVVRMTSRDRRGYGYYVVVRHSNGLETLYAHLSKFMTKINDTLRAGDPVGMGGSTGRSTGYHLHFELRYLGNPINPNDVIDFNTYTIKNKVFLLTAENFSYRKELDKIRYWTIRAGDSLSKIAQKTGVSVSRLCALNGIKANTILRIGRRIRYT